MTHRFVRTLQGLSLGTLLALSPGGLAAQTAAPPAGVRMVSTYDPTTGARAFEVLEPMSGSEILAVQTALADAGSDPGPLDGQLGPSTRRALERFQRERGLEVCGCVSYETVVALGLTPLVIQTTVGTAREAYGVKVFLPKGPPPAPSARPVETGVSGGPGEATGQGTEPGQVPQYVERGYGWWAPVYPFHQPIVEPLRGSGLPGQPGDRGQRGAGERGGILIGPGASRQGGQGARSGSVRLIRPPARGTPRPSPPPRPRPRK